MINPAGCAIDGDSLAARDIERMLCERFDAIDFAQARADVMPFVKDPQALDVWSPISSRSSREGSRWLGRAAAGFGLRARGCSLLGSFRLGFYRALLCSPDTLSRRLPGNKEAVAQSVIE